MTFVAPNLACGEARGGSIAAALCDRRATKPQAKFGATRGAAGLFRPDFVARSLQIHFGYARRSRLVWPKNPLPRTSSYLCLRPLSRSHAVQPRMDPERRSRNRPRRGRITTEDTEGTERNSGFTVPHRSLLHVLHRPASLLLPGLPLPPACRTAWLL